MSFDSMAHKNKRFDEFEVCCMSLRSKKGLINAVTLTTLKKRNTDHSFKMLTILLLLGIEL